MCTHKAYTPTKEKVFELISDYQPAGDQPNAIKEIVNGYNSKEMNQVLLGVTGSGKTFTMAQTIQAIQKPTLIMAPNKTLAAQLFGEMKTFFPNNAVEYFVSYYDYYQPEAYIARTDTYIEKESSINEQIDRMRHSATRSLIERRDVIIVSSVSCLYGIGDVETYQSMTIKVQVGYSYPQKELLQKLVELQYKRNDLDFQRGFFRVSGDIIDIFPAHLDDRAWRLSFFGDELETIDEFDPLTGQNFIHLDQITVFANSHHVTPKPTLHQAIENIQQDLTQQVELFKSTNKLLEAQRIEQRVQFDLEMMQATGICPGIENYSRYLTGRKPGMPPPTLFEYFPKDSLLILDESHVMIPQINGMYKGDRSRKETLAEHGFRLPACIDNRPLKFEEWNNMRPPTLYVSATPGPWELEQTEGVFTEQIIRPTGLLDPVCEIRPVENQVDDLISEAKNYAKNNQRILITTLTKKMAENLADYLHESGVKCRYIHSDIDTIERIEIMRDLRMGVFDALIGINLLREGLDIPECALVAILDADKEGFLRSKTSLIQTIGRAARNVNGRVLLYADTMTQSLKSALKETSRRREKQQKYNAANGITPETIKKSINDILSSVFEADYVKVSTKFDHLLSPHETIEQKIEKLELEMKKAASELEFEKASEYRDEIFRLQECQLELPQYKKR